MRKSARVRAVILLTMATAVRTAVADPVKVTVDPTVVVAHVPDDFLGFGYETSAVAQPGYFTADDATLVRLYRNLGTRGLIRIGGNVSDHARYDSDGTPAVQSDRGVSVVTRRNLADLGSFTRAVGWPVMWGLNLATGTKEQAADESVAVDAALGDKLHSFEVGNEVDYQRPYARDFDRYHADYSAYRAAVRAKLPHAAFSGPDVAGSLTMIDKFTAAEAADLALVTHHYYRADQSDPKATRDRLLLRDDTFDARLDALRDLCDGRHLHFRINEVNSFSGGGKPGVSDTFASSLWCLDYLLDLASHGCGGVNLETDVNHRAFVSSYSPIVHDTVDGHVVCSARPEYYALLAFAAAGRGDVLKTTVDAGGVNLTAFATRAGDGATYLIVVNKDVARDAAVECNVPAGTTAGDVYRLVGPSLDAKEDVTFAGAAVTDDGSWTAGKPEAAAVQGGVLRVAVPHGSAAVVRVGR